ncbi:lipopolysaccharide kinase InaA family protein [uncultured Desulfobacter sp.]|uniref:lipopolysaccharide kinase InaA family protein n=1 Tax=uncultured Desulfobacter sp. TaxID=240139 RepID=UPI0029F548B4|nr:lipopolysaccharide kinase InaA family protein [uncultured Desulfobacter sp.]
MIDEVYSKKTFSDRVMCNKQFLSDDMLRLLDNPDAFLDNSRTEIIQDNFKSKVGIIVLDGKKLVIKRHNYKSQWQKFRRYFRPTRSRRNWYYSNFLISRGVFVPTPVAFVEQRIAGVLRGMAHFVYEYVEGITGEAYFKHNMESFEKIEQGMDMVISLVDRIRELGIIHGDIRMSNLIFKENRICLLDFDDMRPSQWYKLPRVRNRDVRGLKKDIFYNIPPALQKRFLDKLDKYDG